MKEFIIDLRPKSGGFPTQTRLFASNASAALVSARKMYPNYNLGNVKQLN